MDRYLVGISLCIGCGGLGGCRLAGAPSYSLFGAFFPAWLLCSVLGLVAAFLFRGVVIATGLEEAMPLRLLVYTAFGAGLAVWLWLALFGEG
ncbi:MAG: YtcA family lipoprotein [Janthinobacterium lividum]